MENPFDFFDRIYCINLPERADRWSCARDEFITLGILDRVKRIDGVRVQLYSDRRRNACHGNHLAHANCMQDALDSGARNCLIFEDDVNFFFSKEKTANVLFGAIEELPKNFGLFYFGINLDIYTAKVYSSFLVKLAGGYSTHAYAINRHLFERLIAVNRDENVINNDVYYANVIHSEYDCFVTNPLIAGQRDSFSDIQNDKMSSNNMFKQRFQDRLIK